MHCRHKITIWEGIFLVVVIAKTFIFSLEKKRKRRKERKRKGREKREKKKGKDWYVQKTISILLFGWCGPMTLKLFASIWRFCYDLRRTNIPIHCSKSLVKYVLVYIVKLWWGELPSRRISVLLQRIPNILCMDLRELWSNDASYCQFTSLIMFY